MRTIIRLRNQGKSNNPYWWIVVQTSGQKIHGRNHEVVGYWMPRWTQDDQRSIVLNKHRIRYWMNVSIFRGCFEASAVEKCLDWLIDDIYGRKLNFNFLSNFPINFPLSLTD
jgi:ribosomal protein S16